MNTFYIRVFVGLIVQIELYF